MVGWREGWKDRWRYGLTVGWLGGGIDRKTDEEIGGQLDK